MRVQHPQASAGAACLPSIERAYFVAVTDYGLPGQEPVKSLAL
jgi:hypothetical protein